MPPTPPRQRPLGRPSIAVVRESIAYSNDDYRPIKEILQGSHSVLNRTQLTIKRNDYKEHTILDYQYQLVACQN